MKTVDIDQLRANLGDAGIQRVGVKYQIEVSRFAKPNELARRFREKGIANGLDTIVSRHDGLITTKITIRLTGPADRILVLVEDAARLELPLAA